jgi:hypothetical protein
MGFGSFLSGGGSQPGEGLISLSTALFILVAGCSSKDACDKAKELCGAGSADLEGACTGAVKALAECIVEADDCSPAVLLECAGASMPDLGLPGNDGGVNPGKEGGAGGDGSTTTGDREICDRYLACAAAASPVILPELQQGYGASGSCWENGPAEQCLTACRKGLSQLRAAAHAEPACACREDAECLEPGRSTCDPLNGVCGACDSSDGCPYQEACYRSPEGSGCASCYELLATDTEGCGQGAADSPDLWSAAPVCLFDQGTPTCIECRDTMDCMGGECDPITHRCSNRNPNCMGIWECLRHAPVECAVGGSCCSQDRCPSAGTYVQCMATHCAGCTSEGDGCFDCSVTNCTAEYKTCDNSCGG